MSRSLLITLCLSSLLIGQANATGYYHNDSELEALGLALASHLDVEPTAFAKGYVAGVANAGSGKSWCPKNTVDDDHMFRLIAQHLQTHRVPVNRDAVTVITDALTNAYPCENK